MTMSAIGSDKFDKWAESFRSIGHPMRLAVLFMLLGDEILHKRKSFTLSDMRRVLGLPDTKRATNSLLYHVSALLKSEFIEREPSQKEKGKSKVETVYHLSDIGWQFLTDFNVVEQMKKVIKAES